MSDDQLSRVFAALADPTRRDMVARLAAGDATVGQTKDAQRRPCHLEAEVFDLATKWIERYRQQAQERYQRLDTVLAEMQDQPPSPARLPRPGAAS